MKSGAAAEISLRSPFVVRTLAGIVATLVVIWGIGSMAVGSVWGTCYLATGIWSTCFLGMTPAIIKVLVLDRRIGLGMGLVVAKLALILLAVLVALNWPKDLGEPMQVATAIVAGVGTPLLVLVLRALGAAMSNGNVHDILQEIQSGGRRHARNSGSDR